MEEEKVLTVEFKERSKDEENSLTIKIVFVNGLYYIDIPNITQPGTVSSKENVKSAINEITANFLDIYL